MKTFTNKNTLLRKPQGFTASLDNYIKEAGSFRMQTSFRTILSEVERFPALVPQQRKLAPGEWLVRLWRKLSPAAIRRDKFHYGEVSLIKPKNTLSTDYSD